MTKGVHGNCGFRLAWPVFAFVFVLIPPLARAQSGFISPGTARRPSFLRPLASHALAYGILAPTERLHSQLQERDFEIVA
jgi:hypothetical protein